MQNYINAECRVCGFLFIGMSKGEFEHSASRHIVDNHRDQPLDRPLVVPIGGSS